MKTPSCIPLLATLLFAAGCATQHAPFKAPLEPRSSVTAPDFRQSMGAVLGGGFSGGNRITTLVNGDQIFPAMLRAIRSAKRTITFETYVFEKGEVPQLFAEALAERARAGVKVKVIVDAHGASKSRTYHSMMRQAGVEIERYHHIWWPDPRRFNNRTHRKLLVVDGKVGFIGGVGIADEWAGNADSPKHWRDSHYKIEGPAVAELQGAFAANWLRTKEEVLYGPEFFPPLAPVQGGVAGSVFYSAPRHGQFSVGMMYHLAIASARRSLKIENAYFVPNDDMVKALADAARRGVHVQIIVPGEHIDQKTVRRASRKKWKPLLEAGVEIYEYEPTMIHCKLLIADALFVSIGSANFDNRSLHLNDEANFNVIDAKFAAEQARIFEKDRARSRRITEDKSGHLIDAPLQLLTAPLEPQL